MNEARPTLSPGMHVTPSVRLVSPLGAGGMGAVWLADHTSLKTRVVVKFMLGELGASTSARLRFSREAAAAAQVKSPHVVQMHDHGLTEEGLPFIVMEYLEGHDLAHEIAERGALPPARVVMIVRQVAKALTKVHGSGLLHRDIKPDNIFLVASDDDEVYVKLLDFGIAKSHDAAQESTLDGQTKTGQVVGTPFYMSPEQVTAQKKIDARSDLWSLGVVAFEALTGQRPFDGPSFGALAVKIATGEPPKPSDANASLPASVDAWFARACAREPSARFATAKELAEGLREAFEGVVSMPPGTRMSDSGDRPMSGSGPRAVTPGSGSRAGPSTPPSHDEASDRPSFVLASTAAAPSSLAKSEAGLAIGDAPRTLPPERKGPPRFAIVAGIAAIVVVAVVAFTLGRVRRTDGNVGDRAERASHSSTNVHASAGARASSEAPSASTASSPAASASGAASASPSSTPVATADVDAGRAPPRPSGRPAWSPPHKPPPAKPSAEPSAKPASPTPTGDPLF